VVCFSPDLGSTMNQVSCFFPAKDSTCQALQPCRTSRGFPPPALRRHVPGGPRSASPPRPRPQQSRWSLRTGVEHAVRAAARRGLHQLRDGERELLQHRRQRGRGAGGRLPSSSLPAFRSRVGRSGPPRQPPPPRRPSLLSPKAGWSPREGGGSWRRLPRTHSADVFQVPRTSGSNRRPRACPVQRVCPAPSPVGPEGWGGWDARSPAAPLTIKPSLFFPPRMYRLPSLGSGRNAGLGRRREEDGT